MSPEQQDGDYGYDNAHDLEGGQAPPPVPDRDEDSSPPAGMPTVEPDGDYSYDQAHDAGWR